MNKILHIKEAYLKLPDDFSGELSDALFLLYQIRRKSEQLNEIEKIKNLELNDFLNLENKKYSISYEFLE